MPSQCALISVEVWIMVDCEGCPQGVLPPPGVCPLSPLRYNLTLLPHSGSLLSQNPLNGEPISVGTALMTHLVSAWLSMPRAAQQVCGLVWMG